MPRLIPFLLLLSLLVLSQVTQGQVTGTVLDKTTRLPVPYASIWLEKEDKGTTAEADGRFLLRAPGRQPRNLVVTAVGYEKSLVPLGNQALQVLLNPRPVMQPAEQASKPAHTRKKVAGSLAWTRLKTDFYGNEGHPYVLARYFPYDSSYANTPFVQSVSLLTRSKLPQASFQLRLFAADAQGNPGQDLLPGGLLVLAEKGQHQTLVDLSSYQVVMPPNGLFIGFEWLIIEANRYEYTRSTGKLNHQAVSYEPHLGVSQEEGSERWMYLRGTWRRSSDQKKEINTKLLFQLNLTD